MKQVLFGLAVAVALLGCASSPTTQEEVEAPHDYAAEFAKGKEARAWMATGRNHMFEASDEVCNEVIAELYRLGAEEVRVTDGDKLDEDSSGEIAATLMAKLPSDAAKRKALFEYEKENSEFADESQKREFVEIVFD